MFVNNPIAKNMWLFSLDASSARSSLALTKLGAETEEWLECQGSLREENAGSHAEELLTLLDGLCKKACIKPEEISSLVVGSGPGSFTGLRIGFSFMKGFALSFSASLDKQDTFSAYAHEFGCDTRLILTVSDARREEFFSALYVSRHNENTADGEFLLQQLAPVAIRKQPELALLVNDNLAKFSLETSQALVVCPDSQLPNLCGLNAVRPQHTAKNLARLALANWQKIGMPAKSNAQSLSLIEPLYLRAVNAKTIEERRRLGI